MSKRTEDLAFKYNIRGSVDEMSMFVSEVYNDGYHDGKAFKDRHLSLRDHFAGLAMQGMVATSNNMNTIAQSAYDMADAMLKERGVGECYEI